MNLLNKTGITLSLGLVIALSSGSVAQALTLFNVNINGTFGDGGTFSGSFQYDSDAGQVVAPVNITTSGGGFLGPTTYSIITFSDNISLNLRDQSDTIPLVLSFSSSLDTLTGTVSAAELARPMPFSFGSGMFTSTPVAVPYEFESATGLAILGLGYGLNKLRKRKSNPSQPETNPAITEEKTEKTQKELTHV